MKIKNIHLEKFKRFTDLTIDNIPSTAKLVMLVGPNGCGKSSLFDAFKTWHLSKAYGNVADNTYCRKDQRDYRNSGDLVNIQFHGDEFPAMYSDSYRQAFYFRTAYRNSPEISVTSLQTVDSPLKHPDYRMMIQNDSTVDENYQRLISATISSFFNQGNDEKNVKSLRNELLDKIRLPLHRLFPDLTLSGIGMVTEKAEFYFNKGTSNNIGYEMLSGGEKAAFDLILDIVIKSEYYQDTVFCIDEPETHIHTSLQANLLSELFALVPDNSQLWIATHSFGMMKETKQLSELHPEEVVFLNFDGYDFDEPVIITPSECDTVLWNKMLELTLDDYAPFMSPETIVFCEGATRGRKRKDFDARCYTTIFERTHPRVLFYSLGNCDDVEKAQQIIDFVSRLSPRSNTIKLVDRDDRSPEEIAELEAAGVKVLSRRHIESYLLDDDVLKKWCKIAGKADKETEMLVIKQTAMGKSTGRGNAPDDVKSASNEICTEGKRLLGVTGCGNNGEMIMRDTLAKLITPDMAVYQELERDIFSQTQMR